MTYDKGQEIDAGAINLFIGDPGGGADKSLVAFSGAAAATFKVAALFGVGFGDRGYGQTTQSLTLVGVGTTIFSTAWTAMIVAITEMETHQGIASPGPPVAEVAIGELIEAHESSSPTLNIFDLNSAIVFIDASRLATDSGVSLTTVVNGITSTRGSTWSSTIEVTATATFTTAETARHFFNTGGSLTVVGAQPGSTDQDIEWARIFSTELGTVEIRANDTINSGSGGVIAGAGYYQLTGSLTRHYNGTDIGSGVYGANDVFVDASFTGATTNGAKGNIVTIKVELRDQHIGDEDTVGINTAITFGHRYAGAASILAGIEQPTWAITDTL